MVERNRDGVTFIRECGRPQLHISEHTASARSQHSVALSSFRGKPFAMAKAYIEGPSEPELWELTLPQLLQQQSSTFGSRNAALFPWQSVRFSYDDMLSRSEDAARSMLALGLKHGDAIGIIAGNRYEYIEGFLGAGRIGCPYTVLNNTYTPRELVSALKVVCKYCS